MYGWSGVRRHMTKGQQYMAIAMITPAQKGGRGKTVAVPQGFSKERISNARTVLQHAPDLARQVLQGSAKLTAAHKAAKLIKVDSATQDTRLGELRERYPELADRVVEGELLLEGRRSKPAR